MTLNGLTDSPLLAIQLHRAFHLESRRIRRVARDTDDNHPVLARRNAIVDDLAAGQCGVTVEHLLRRSGSVRDRPVVYGSICDEAEVRVGRPFPEHDIFVVNVGFDFLLRLDVEDL